MITVEEAKKIGVQACIDKIGRDLVEANKDKACMGCGNGYQHVWCFVGVDEKEHDRSGGLLLDSTSKFDHQASCKVSLVDGDIVFECV